MAPKKRVSQSCYERQASIVGKDQVPKAVTCNVDVRWPDWCNYLSNLWPFFLLMACTKEHPSDQCAGPGYPSPMHAFRHGPREKMLYVTTVSLGEGPDNLVVVDVNPSSENYGKIVRKLAMPFAGDELHHFGWNSCSSCYDDADCERNKMVLPCLNSNRIYVVEVDRTTGLDMKIVKIIDDLPSKMKVSAPHTAHCAPDKSVMVSCMGDESGHGKGSIIRMSGQNLSSLSHWTTDHSDFGYDFWYQPRHNVLITSEWGSPNAWRRGLNGQDLAAENYGHSIHIYEWTSGKRLQTIDLGKEDGLMPLEVRFLHDPQKAHAFVGCAFSSSVFHIFRSDDRTEWRADKIIQVARKKVRNWLFDYMPGVITDIILSMDDKFLYFSNWIQGDIRQYNVTDPSKPIFVSSVVAGGSLCNDSRIEILREDNEDKSQDNLVARPKVKGKPLRGGPQMLQLSLDGRRLYVTNSLYSAWDAQFYPDLAEHGSMMVKIDVDHEKGGMAMNGDFLVDFGEDRPMLAHEMRYPGGDCTSDIWC